MSGPTIADDDVYLFLGNDAAERVKSITANFVVDGKPPHYELTEDLEGKILIFTSVENKKEKSVSFYSLELDKKNLHFLPRA